MEISLKHVVAWLAVFVFAIGLIASIAHASGINNPGSGSSGGGNVATSTGEVTNEIPTWTSTNGAPATLGNSGIFSGNCTGLSPLWAAGASSTDSGNFDFDNCSTGLNAFHIGSSGFVGIGTVSPTALLTLDAGLVGTSSPLLEIGTTTTSRYIGISGDRVMIGENSFAFGLAGAGMLMMGTNKGFQLGVNGITGNFGPGGTIAISIDPQNNMTITSTTTITATTTFTGNVGIASSTPSDPLDIAITGNFGSVAQALVMAVASTTGGGTGTTSLMRLRTDGTLNIGNSTFPSLSAIGNPTGNAIISGILDMASNNIFVPSTGNGIFFNSIGNFNAGIERFVNNALGFVPFTNPTVGGEDYTYFSTNGNWGIGSSTPLGRFVVQLNNGQPYPGNIAFQIASSTATATSTLFEVDNRGNHYTGGDTPALSTCGTSVPVGDNNGLYINLSGTNANCYVIFADGGFASTTVLSRTICTFSESSTLTLGGIAAASSTGVQLALAGNITGSGWLLCSEHT